MEIIQIPIERINPTPYNPRVDLQPGDSEYEKLKRSLMEFGFVEPLVWNERTCNLVGGHQRFKVLVNDMGATEVEVSVVDLDETREKALNIALNKISGDWDREKLKDLLEELDTGDIDVSLTGFDDTEIENLMAEFAYDGPEVVDDDFDIDQVVREIEVPITQTGDIWQLGRHRVICGDATSTGDFARLMNGGTASMVFTDPPYNVNYESNDGKTIANDNMDASEFAQLLRRAFTNAFNVMAPGGAIYIAHSDSEGVSFRKGMTDSGWLLKQCLVWVKNSFVLGRQDYQWQHEPTLWMEARSCSPMVWRAEAADSA